MTTDQVSAWLMAAYIQGLDEDETLALTEAMARSGQMLDLSSLPGPHVDKHSTGGVGDKTTLVLVPLLAACGCTVVKLSGRGLGITGGTIDKLDSIPGFRTDLSGEEMISIAREVGCCIGRQSKHIAPADGILYGIRDATATVDRVPLITASIMSKKIASGAEVISLDVKCGKGSFMPTLAKARELAGALIDVGRGAGRKVSATITDMATPLGCAVGNALEVAEAIETLMGGGPERFVELCIALASETLVTAGIEDHHVQARQLVRTKLKDGSAHRKFAQVLAAQGADPRLASRPDAFVRLPSVAVTSEHDGWVADIDASIVGNLVMEIGAGRLNRKDPIDLDVGVILRTSVGSHVSAGSLLADIYARGDATAACEGITRAIRFSDEPVTPQPVVLEELR